jgi:hypothetical protein
VEESQLQYPVEHHYLHVAECVIHQNVAIAVFPVVYIDEVK